MLCNTESGFRLSISSLAINTGRGRVAKYRTTKGTRYCLHEHFACCPVILRCTGVNICAYSHKNITLLKPRKEERFDERQLQFLNNKILLKLRFSSLRHR
jgi:hypothetical protein